MILAKTSLKGEFSMRVLRIYVCCSVKKGVGITRDVIGVAKHIPVVGEVAGEVEKGLDLVGLGYDRYGKRRY